MSFLFRLSLVFAAAMLCLASGQTPTLAKPAGDEPRARAHSQPSGGKVKPDSKAAQAFKQALKGRYKQAADLARASGDPAAAKLVEWLYVRRSSRDAGYQRIMAFVGQNPHWPYIESMTKRAESLLFAPSAPLEHIRQHFAERKPISAKGKLALARLHLADGKESSAARLVREAWLDTGLDAAGEKAARKRFKGIITRSMTEMRLWALIHAQHTRAARRVAKTISKTHHKAAVVAWKLIQHQAGADKLYRKLPASMRDKLAMKYALARYYRKRDKFDKARAMLLDISAEDAHKVDPEQWWIEKRIIIRYSIGKNDKDHWHAAYKLATSHGFTTDRHFLEAEFLAGWIALSKLNKPETALKHFQAMPPQCRSRTQASRAYYWLARAHAAAGNAAEARAAYQSAASSPTLYYGQLAREALGKGRQPIALKTGKATTAAKSIVAGDELVRAYRIVSAAGADGLLSGFLKPIAKRFSSPGEMAAASDVIHAESGYAFSVRFAKYAGGQGHDIDHRGYPVRALPQWKQLGKPVEKAMVFGISRQESEFHPRAQSQAGARGLMQLMPATAKLVAKRYKQRYSKAKLTKKPTYNLALGAALLGDLVNNFKGSYILAFASYNAGPGNTVKWLKRFGDPRTGEIDPIDWVESIPFTETRKYVQKVLQNVHVYRTRLAPDTMREMTADLARGGQRPASGYTSACGTSARSIAGLIATCR